MPEISLEKTYALLEKLTEYVMNEVPKKSEVPTKDEMNARFTQVDKRFAQVDRRFEQVDKRFEQVDKRFEQVDRRFALMEQRLERLELEKADKKDIETIINILDKQTKQIDIIRTEQVAFNHAFRRLERRVEILEEKI